MVPKKPFLFPLGEPEEQGFKVKLPHFVVRGQFDWAHLLVSAIIKVLVVIIIFRGLL